MNNSNFAGLIDKATGDIVKSGIVVPLAILQRALVYALQDRASLESVRLSSLTPGVSGAKVLLIESFSGGTRDIPMVVKFGPVDLIRQEISNYKKYVAPKLRTAPLLLHDIEDDTEGVLVYELAGASMDYKKIQTLKSYFEDHKEDGLIGPALISDAVRDLRSWHHGVKVSQGSIFDALRINNRIPNDSVTRWAKEIHDFDSDLPLYDLQLAWDSLSKNWPFSTYHTSVQHCDLNVGNIVIDGESHRPYLIDFASVRPNMPVFRDLAKIMRETLLRLYVAEEMGDGYLKGLKAMMGSLKIFFNFPPSSEPVYDLPMSFESSFSLSMNFGPWALYLMEKIEETCGSKDEQLKAELLVSVFFQCLLFLLPGASKAQGQELGAVYVCHILLDMLAKVCPKIASGLPASLGE